MARRREIKGHVRPVTLMLTSELFDQFAETLPKDKSVSKAIREYMQSCVDQVIKDADEVAKNFEIQER